MAYDTEGYGKVANPFWDLEEKESGGGTGGDLPTPARPGQMLISKFNQAQTALETAWKDIFQMISEETNLFSSDEADVGKVFTKYGSGSRNIGWVKAQAAYTDYSNASSGLSATNVQSAIDEIAGSAGGATVLPVSTDTNSLQKVLKYMIDHGKKIAFIPSMAFELKESTGPKITCGRISDTALSGGNGTIAFKDDAGIKYAIKMVLDGAEIFFESVYVHLTYYDDGTYGYQLSYRRATLKQVGNSGSLKIVKDSDGSNVNTFTFANINTFFGTPSIPKTLNDYLFSGIDISDCIKAIYGTIDYDGTTIGTDRLNIFGDRGVSYVDIINKILFKGSLVVDLTGSGISYPTSQAYPTGADVTDSSFSTSEELNRISSSTIEVYEEDENIILV